MAKALIEKDRTTGRFSQWSNGDVTHTPDVQFDELAGSIRVRDPRMIQKGQRAFCRRLVESLARQDGVRKVEIHLPSSACHVDFARQTARSQSMADTFASSVREAAGGRSQVERSSWWPLGGGWLKLTAYPLRNDVSVWETLDIQPGRMRIRNGLLATDNGPILLLADAVSQLDGVENCHAHPRCDALTIVFRPNSPIAVRLLDKVQSLLEDLIATKATGRGPAERNGLGTVTGAPKVATGSRRIINLALAGGSLVVTGVALVIPGIPFLPFLLATSYYLARSSPWMDQKLRRFPFMGTILVEWEQYGRLSRLSKLKLVSLTVVISFSIVLIGLSPVGLVVVLLISSAMTYAILRTPEIGDPPRMGRSLETSTRLALPAP